MSPHRRAAAPVAIEPLEPRRFLAADLVATIDVDPQIISRFGNTQVFRASATVTNVGDATGFAFYEVRFVLSRDATIGNGDDVTIGTETVHGTFPGDSKTVQAPTSLPAGVASGAYRVGVIVDTGKEVAESNENNNTAVTGSALVTVHDGTGVLNLEGTSGADTIVVDVDGSAIRITRNGVESRLLPSSITSLNINLGDGNDSLTFTDVRLRARVSGGNGNDTIRAGAAPDTIAGGAGSDRLFGGGGRDRISGNGGNDRIVGHAGADLLYGNGGDDLIEGGAGGDLLNGGDGRDNLLGQAGNDRLFARDGEIDVLVSGGGGTDSASFDNNDPRSSLERTA